MASEIWSPQVAKRIPWSTWGLLGVYVNEREENAVLCQNWCWREWPSTVPSQRFKASKLMKLVPTVACKLGPVFQWFHLFPPCQGEKVWGATANWRWRASSEQVLFHELQVCRLQQPSRVRTGQALSRVIKILCPDDLARHMHTCLMMMMMMVMVMVMMIV